MKLLDGGKPLLSVLKVRFILLLLIWFKFVEIKVLCNVNYYSHLMSSTSKIKVELGGMTPGCPKEP